MNLLVGISPAGAVTFLSDVWGGRVSDRQITTESDLIKKDLLEPGDSVMADRGFDVEDVLAQEGVLLNIPPYLNGCSHFSGKEVVQTIRITELRIHVERAIGRARKFYHLELLASSEYGKFSQWYLQSVLSFNQL